MNDTGQRVIDYLAAREDEMVRFLEKLVRFETPSSEPDRQGAPLTFLADALEQRGQANRRLTGRTSGGQLLSRPVNGRGRSCQFMVGHVDTVWPVGTLEQMPFVREDNVVKGPGVYDMKGGLTQMVFALDAIRALGLEPEVVPCLFINTDEEVGSRDSRIHIDRLARVADRVFVLEPSLGLEGRIKTARKGVGRYTIRIKGRAAHAGLDPEGGVSAILELTHQIQRLFAMNNPDAGISVNVGTVDGGLGANVIAPESSCLVDVRVPTAELANQLDTRIRGLAGTHPETEVTVEGGFGRPPLESTPRNRALWQVARERAGQLGLALEGGQAGGGSDGNFCSRHTATLDGLGAVGDGAHALHEFLYVDRLIERTALLVLLLMAPPLKEEGAP